MTDLIFRKYRSCTHKKGYQSMKDASRDAGAMKRKGYGHFTCFFCPWCQRWHVGHTPLRIIYADRLQVDQEDQT